MYICRFKPCAFSRDLTQSCSINFVTTGFSFLESKACLKDEGAEFILENFDTYFSIILDSENLPLDVVLRGSEDLQRAATDLERNLKFLLEDKESLNDEVKAKYLNILKMTIYVYTNITILVRQKETAKQGQSIGIRVSNLLMRYITFINHTFFRKEERRVMMILDNLIKMLY